MVKCVVLLMLALRAVFAVYFVITRLAVTVMFMMGVYAVAVGRRTSPRRHRLPLQGATLRRERVKILGTPLAMCATMLTRLPEMDRTQFRTIAGETVTLPRPTMWPFPAALTEMTVLTCLLILTWPTARTLTGELTKGMGLRGSAGVLG